MWYSESLQSPCTVILSSTSQPRSLTPSNFEGSQDEMVRCQKNYWRLWSKVDVSSGYFSYGMKRLLGRKRNLWEDAPLSPLYSNWYDRSSFSCFCQMICKINLYLLCFGFSTVHHGAIAVNTRFPVSWWHFPLCCGMGMVKRAPFPQPQPQHYRIVFFSSSTRLTQF